MAGSPTTSGSVVGSSSGDGSGGGGPLPSWDSVAVTDSTLETGSVIPPAGSPPDTSATGLLVLCGVPIGDVRDASRRLGETLSAADIIAAEDTRRLRRLSSSLGIEVHAEGISYFDAKETE